MIALSELIRIILIDLYLFIHQKSGNKYSIVVTMVHEPSYFTAILPQTPPI